MNQNYFYKPYVPKTLKNVACAVCDSQQGDLVVRENSLDILRCQVCGYVYVNPRPCVADLKDFYEEYYPDQDGLPESWGGEMRGVFLDSYRKISAKCGQGRVLDIGSSYGHFLSQFNAQNWDCVGIDPSSNAIAYSRQHYPHIRAHAANFEDVDLKPGSFDVITSFYVLEHVFDPREMMRRINELLVDGGISLIRIPYTRPFFTVARMLGRPLMYAPMHLNDFSPAQFEHMCRDIGFARVNSSIGARRNSSDLVENIGAAVFSGVGRAYEMLTFGQHRFPYAGAYTYELYK